MEYTPSDVSAGEADDSVWMNTLKILTAIRGRDVAEEAEQGKEEIWERVKQKTFGRTGSRTMRKKGFVLLFASVAASLAVGLMAGFWSYRSGYNDGIDKLAAGTIEVQSPLGVISKVALPDGSQVTLNGGSKLTYPAFFAGNDRRVSLDGEGYFEVRSDSSRLFTVGTTGMDVRVYGTKFSLKSYRDDPQVSVTLAEGSIDAVVGYGSDAETIQMRPDQQVNFDRLTGEVERVCVDAGEHTAWQKGKFYFRNVTLKSIARQLERKFDVKIQIENEELGNKVYYCQFENGENLEQILNLLSYKNNWYSTISGKEVRIYPAD